MARYAAQQHARKYGSATAATWRQGASGISGSVMASKKRIKGRKNRKMRRRHSIYQAK